MVKKGLILLIVLLLLAGCQKENETKEEPGETIDEAVVEPIETEEVQEKKMKLKINDTEVEVVWEENESVRELEELAEDGGLTIQMSMYGGFEQVGPIGQRISRNDSYTVTEAGDIVLYSGNQIVVFYGSNAWDYTRLGKMQLSEAELRDLLSNGDVTLTLSFE